MKLFCFALCISYGLSFKLPSDIKLCHRSQPNFNDCVAKAMKTGLTSFASGNRELGLPVLNPYFIEKLEIQPPTTDKALSVHQLFTNINVYGMTDSEVVHAEINLDKGCSWIMDAVTPIVSFVGDYQMDGKILVFPINSHGKCNVSQIGLRNRHSMWCEKYKKDGKTHIRVTNFTMDMHPAKLIFNFTDIFPSNKDIENQIAKTVNENSLALFNEIKGAFEQSSFATDTMWCEKYKKNGETHIHVTNYPMDMHPDNMLYDYTDIFPSNRDIEKQILKTMDENSLLLFSDRSRQLNKFSQKFTLKWVLGKSPLDQIFLPYLIILKILNGNDVIVCGCKVFLKSKSGLNKRFNLVKFKKIDGLFDWF